MQILNTFLAAGMIALAPTVTLAAEANWIADYDEAVKVAQAEGKDLLVDFTGSDWCYWCIKLHDEVFSFEEFETFAADRFVLVALDFPNDQATKDFVPNPERNQELAAKYNVGGYPTILLMTADGEVFGRTGYQEGGPEKYNEHLGEMLTSGKAELASSKALVAEWATATDETRAALWARVMDTFEGLSQGSVGAAPLMDIVRAGIELDSENKGGMKLRSIKALLGAGETDEALLTVAKEMDPKNESGLFEIVVKAQCDSVRAITDLADAVAAVLKLDEMGIKDQKIAGEMYSNCAYWSWKYLENKEDALLFAGKVQAMEGIDQSTLDMIKDLLNELQPTEEDAVEEEAAE
jgi:thioredoxin-related protein